MKQRKRWMAVLTVWTIALLFAAGFTSQASVSSSKMIQEKNSKYTTGAGAIAAAMESIPAEAVELTKAEAQKAQEAREQAEAEAKRKAEEEAARKAAEEAARAQIAAEDQKLLASIIFCEAGNQPYEGQVAVGAVIMNRVRSGVYPNSISEVIYQSGQFGPAMTGWLDTVRSRKDIRRLLCRQRQMRWRESIRSETVCILEMEIMEFRLEIISSIKN